MRQFPKWPVVLSALIMASGSLLGGLLQPTRMMAKERARAPISLALPDSIGGWRMDKSTPVVELPPDVAAQVKSIYTEVADKVYVDSSGNRMMVTLAYGRDQSDGFKVHRPEICYAAQGFTVSSPKHTLLDLGDRKIKVNRVDTSLAARSEPVTYWMVIGDKVVDTPLSHKLEQIKYSFSGLVPDGLLVRVSSLSPNNEASYQMHERFVREWLKSVPIAERERYFGI